ncbi:hypothetical protein LX15_005935 [Streptoalloteichus tenebrarius]|uniref:Uncharacterized protein n=1 Tax=Streptoalloteichus tenebrarius (strain ATCC 17920 / DSM 40477 / JCM 4838 / CBS 697.72 / NBRC 16177 / NCIMB 11028 / NRRL B-12390 / A12253. 1 / ISP 5477) TaxID=1933 RepID=A0ABT1I337_STRSD|nr:hypothetical protein [Streptoalloteichus tenebrarius]MCP2262201.1 hypothetical protein [Streptoalloteichus tenebrarius]BFE98961.1 hypothetical protein GCM10020241_06370 [Streptoalloteichus tenebrarius]
MQVFGAVLPALKNLGGVASATLDLGRPCRFLVWCGVSMVDSLGDFDRDNAYVVDIFTVDDTRTASRVHGGDHWGPEGSTNNVLEGALVGMGQRITVYLRAIHTDDLDVFGFAVALTLD